MQRATIKLGGFLGKKYGKTFHLCVRNPAEAVALLAANFSSFQKDFIKHNYRVMVNEEVIDKEDIQNPCVGKCIRFIPVLAGSGNVGRIVAGIVLVVVGTVASAYLGPVGGAMVSMGYGLIVGGIVGLMFGTNPSAQNESQDSSKTSYLFGGTLNTTGQGNPVPILYGRRMVGSQVISAGISTEAI